MSPDTPAGAGNTLSGSPNPYLRQHAANPVHWMPWGDDAFNLAKSKDRPIFLSIGYSTCHWCHVMERESFREPEVAALLNRNFVSIKVDREERPDIDHLYLTVCQTMTGNAGWPLTIIMTPDKKPFFAGTYLPRHSRMGRVGLVELVLQVADLWRNQRDSLLENSVVAMDALRTAMDLTAQGPAMDENVLKRAAAMSRPQWDTTYGGFGMDRKFPVPHKLMMLLRHHRRTGDESCLRHVVRTLDAMSAGGIHDQVGGGFHRYATDRRWMLPHFEKMLSDQALILMAYTEAFRTTVFARFSRAMEDIVTYLCRDMAREGGGFFTAEDADNADGEGRYYLWRYDEMLRILPTDIFPVAREAWGLKPGGNFVDESDQGSDGMNILLQDCDVKVVAKRLGLSVLTTGRKLEDARRRLLAARSKRPRPARDEKVLTDQNGLVMAALAGAGVALNRPDYVETALQAARFISDTLSDRLGNLKHSYFDGHVGGEGLLSDYAGFTLGLMELYQATFDPTLLQEAVTITDRMLQRFTDPATGGFFMNAAESNDLPLRPLESFDGAGPTGASLAAWNLARLADLTGRDDYRQQAIQLMNALAGVAGRAPAEHAMLMVALDYLVGPSCQVVLTGPSGELEPFVRALCAGPATNRVMLYRGVADGEELEEVAPFVKDKQMVEGKMTAYVCTDTHCASPVTTVQEMMALIK